MSSPSQKPSKDWLVFLIILTAAALAVVSVAAFTTSAGISDPLQLTEPDYPGIITDDPGQIIERPVIDPDPIVCLYGCPNPSELSEVTLTKETGVIDYD